MTKMLVIDVDRCFGCGACELACSFFHTGEFSRSRSRISVFRWDKTCDAVPVVCTQCQDAPCMEVCGVAGAMTRDKATGAVIINYDLCIGCRLCMYNCPYGAISLDPVSGLVIKCDLCIERLEAGEEPACVAACPTGALQFRPIDEVPAEKRRDTARKLVIEVKEARRKEEQEKEEDPQQ